MHVTPMHVTAARMTTMRLCRAATIAFALLLACGITQARTLEQVPAYFKKEGNFVAYPAIAGGLLGMFVGGVISLPAVLIAAPIGWAAGDPLGYAMVPLSVLATGGGEIGYNIGGAIPWALKNGFYDAPMQGIARIKGESPSGLVAQVEPPPVTSGDTQYLDSTPGDARIPVVLSRQSSAALPPPKEPTSLMLRRQLSPFKPPVKPAPRPPVASVVPAAGVSAPAPAPAPAPEPEPQAFPAVQAQASLPQATPAESETGPLVEPASPTTKSPEAEAEAERPSLKSKKKRKFSERFRF